MSAPASPTQSLLAAFFPGSQGVITQSYGSADTSGAKENGIDIAYRAGTEVTTPFSGVVTAVRGQLVALQLAGQSTVIYFQHIFPFPGLTIGQQIPAGTAIGTISNLTGNGFTVPNPSGGGADPYWSSGPHLEFGVQAGPSAATNTANAIANSGGTNPLTWLAGQGDAILNARTQPSGGSGPFGWPILGGLLSGANSAGNAISSAGTIPVTGSTPLVGGAENAITAVPSFLGWVQGNAAKVGILIGLFVVGLLVFNNILRQHGGGVNVMEAAAA